MSITRGPRNAADGTVSPAVVAAAAATASPVVAASPPPAEPAEEFSRGAGDHTQLRTEEKRDE